MKTGGPNPFRPSFWRPKKIAIVTVRPGKDENFVLPKKKRKSKGTKETATEITPAATAGAGNQPIL